MPAVNRLRQLSSRARLSLLLLVTAGLALATALWPRVPQWAHYHDFADQRALLGVPHCLDVFSNLPFAVIGLLGLGFVLRGRDAFLDSAERWCWGVFFMAVFFTCWGSAWYHLAPDNARLVWDRMPISVAAMAFLAAVVGERISPRAGMVLLLPLAALGAASVFYWSWTELQGAGDLRLYGFVQFFPVLAVPLVMLLYPPRYTRGADLVIVIGFYALAKALEVLDKPIFAATGVLSGHTLKHLVAAAAAFWVWRMLRRRQPA